MEAIVEDAQIAKYSVYKDSGVDWLGEIPVHWEIEKGKWLFEKQERPVREEDGIVTAFRDGQVTLRSNRREDGFTNAIQEHGYQGIRKGDLVIHAMDAFAGAIGVSDSDGKSSPVYAACTPKAGIEVNAYYYAYLLRNLAITGFIESLAKGIRERSTDFRFKDFGALLLPVPQYEEQTAIAQFLNRKMAQIDKAICIKEKQIALLKERKQILIHKAVTRGLNPDVPVKDSGVEWIGEITAHWEISRLKNHIDMITGYPFKSEKYTDEGVKLARGINVKEGVFNWDETRYWPVIERHLEGYLLQAGDVLIGMDGSKVGKNFCQVQHSDLPILLLQRVARLRAKDTIFPKFLFRHISNRNFLMWVEMSKTDPMVPHIAPKDINNFLVTIPPLDEQKAISEFIDIIVSKIGFAISSKEQEIERLKEYKASLINSAVTGKIKVC